MESPIICFLNYHGKSYEFMDDLGLPLFENLHLSIEKSSAVMIPALKDIRRWTQHCQ